MAVSQLEVSGECPRCELGLQTTHSGETKHFRKTLPRRQSREVAAHFSKQVVSNKKSSLKLSCISNPARKVRASEMSTAVGGEGSIRHHNYSLRVLRKKEEAEINTETNCTISRVLLSRLEWNMQKQQLNVLAYTLFSMISGHLWH